MARYFFDCFDGKVFRSDVHGMELSNMDEVADQGACLARELLSEVTESFGSLGVSVMIRNAHGAQVYVAHCGFHALPLPETAHEGAN